VPGSSFGLIAAGYTITGMLDGIAIYAGLQVSRYELFKSISTSVVFLIFKILYLIWPAILFHFNNLIMVSEECEVWSPFTYILHGHVITS